MSPEANNDSKTVQILLGTWNGADFLAGQISSLKSQDAARIDVLASDDGSTDGTTEILREAAASWTLGRFVVVEGPQAGFPENYRKLILEAPAGAGLYAFCDQDDIWRPGKIARARQAIDAVPANRPALYCGRTRLIDEDGRPNGMSPLMARPPSFRNALVQSIAGANTMVMNASAFELLREASKDSPFVSHDWWAYLVISGAGGQVIYDPEPTVDYRQHENNSVGANVTLAARLTRLAGLFGSRFRQWHDMNLTALDRNAHLLDPANVALLADYRAARATGNSLALFKAIRRHGLYRQSGPGNVSLLLGAMLMKV